MFSDINKFISKRISLTEKEYAFFNTILVKQTFKKKQIILQPGMICDFEAYVTKGLFRTYFINESGNEKDLFFAPEDWWIGDLVSFSQQKPSNLYIQALEDSEVLMVNYENKKVVFNEIPAFERLFRLMVQKAYETMMDRFISTISETSESRYLSFIQKYPSIPLRVPQHMIASYLGITPEFLSKIRSKLSKRNL